MRNHPFSIDLHTHVRGSISPQAVRELAAKNQVHVPSYAMEALSSSSYPDFETFLEIYDRIGRVISKPEDLARVTIDHLSLCAKGGTRYVEFMLSPDHSAENGLPITEQFDAIAAGIDEARRRFGIEAAVIATAVRHRGPEAAVQLAEKLSSLAHPIVRGFGLTGNERLFDAREFSGAFYVARLAGLGCTAHAGEWRDAKSVLEAINELGLSRVGHGLSVADDPDMLKICADREIVFEVCLSSNLKLGRCESIGHHPVRKMLDAGCRVTLATDDPSFFATTPANEYRIAMEAIGLSKSQILTINDCAIEGAFCSNDIKQKLKSSLLQASYE